MIPPHHNASSWCSTQTSVALVLMMMVSPLLMPYIVEAHPTSMGNTAIHVKPESQDIDLLASVALDDLGEYLKLDRDGNNVTDTQELHEQRAIVLDYMTSRLTVTQNGKPCETTAEHLVPTAKQRRIHVMKSLRCPQPLTTITLSNRILFEDTGGHRHTARIQHGEQIYTTVFSREAPD
ncbi:MAG: DUF6702 family protein, partial [Myxococcota bacterium]